MDIYKAKLVFFHGTKNFTKKKKDTIISTKFSDLFCTENLPK